VNSKRAHQENLEDVLQCHLHLARRTGCAGHAPARHVVNVRIGNVEARCVREIEALETELQAAPFRDLELLEHREIRTLEIIFPQDVTACVSIGVLSRQDECQWVKPLLDGRVVALAGAKTVRPLPAHTDVCPIRSDRRCSLPSRWL